MKAMKAMKAKKSDEGIRFESYDLERSLPGSGGVDGREAARCERRVGGIPGRGDGTGQEERVFQVLWRLEFEIEEEACEASAQGYQPVYEGALRIQSEASIEDREG